jgi:prepilin-type N-terminal cleavage/methylation domain-containing protein
MRILPRRPAGFTLLELLAVITIIAILSAALLTTMGIVQRKSRENLTKSHFQLLKSALDRYAGDFDDYPPSDGDGLKGAQSLYECLSTTKKGGPYLQPGDIPTCDASGNGDMAYADQWKHPIYYMHHHDYRNQAPNKHDFRLISAGPNGRFEDGDKNSDDIVNWNKDKPE